MPCLAAANTFANDKGDRLEEGVYVYDGIYDIVNKTFKEPESQFPVDLIDCSDEQSLCYYSEASRKG